MLGFTCVLAGADLQIAEAALSAPGVLEESNRPANPVLGSLEASVALGYCPA